LSTIFPLLAGSRISSTSSGAVSSWRSSSEVVEYEYLPRLGVERVRDPDLA
jgi:hypothetical protein